MLCKGDANRPFYPETLMPPLMIFKKKAKKNEDEIVDKLIQLYSSERTVEQRILDYVERQAKTEHEKNEMLQSLNDYKHTQYPDAIFDDFKKQLFGANKKGCMLTHLELSVCFLICTKNYFPEVIIDILWIDKNEFQQVIQSLEDKITRHGYKLPKSYLEMQPIVRSFFEVGQE